MGQICFFQEIQLFEILNFDLGHPVCKFAKGYLVHAFCLRPNNSISFYKKGVWRVYRIILLARAGSIILATLCVLKHFLKRVMDELKTCLVPLKISCSPVKYSLKNNLATHPTAQTSTAEPLTTYDFVPGGPRGKRAPLFWQKMVNLSLQAPIYRLPPTSILKLCKQGFVTSKVKLEKREMPLKH